MSGFPAHVLTGEPMTPIEPRPVYACHVEEDPQTLRDAYTEQTRRAFALCRLFDVPVPEGWVYR